MQGMLKVTPEKLIETAGEFANTEANIRRLTQEMVSVVDAFKPIWQGEAATGFANRFAALTEDMNSLYMLIRKHADDLNEIASEYMQAEQESTELAGSLAAGGAI